VKLSLLDLLGSIAESSPALLTPAKHSRAY
jgi:hypothetical protein